MRIRLDDNKLPAALAAAGLLLAIGLVVEIFFARPRLQEIRALTGECAGLQAQLQDQLRLDGRSSQLAVHFGMPDLGTLAQPPRSDAVAYLGQTLDRSGLRRQDMTSSGGEDFGRLRRSDFVVSAHGDYAQFQTFVRELEAGQRLAVIDALSIRPLLESRQLEGRFNISVYDPTGVQ